MNDLNNSHAQMLSKNVKTNPCERLAFGFLDGCFHLLFSQNGTGLNMRGWPYLTMLLWWTVEVTVGFLTYALLLAIQLFLWGGGGRAVRWTYLFAHLMSEAFEGKPGIVLVW